LRNRALAVHRLAITKTAVFITEPPQAAAAMQSCINPPDMLNRYNMQLGINQNILYKGSVYHIQTEDGGMNNPVITTIIVNEGKILASKRIGYADIIKSDKLDIVIKELMTEQHDSFVKGLEEGRFDKGPETPAKAG
jgi:hypothetical protein